MIVSDIIRLSSEGEITHKKIIFRSNYFRQVLLTPVYAAIALFGVVLIIYSLISYAEVKELTELCVGFIGGLILAIPFCYLIMSNIVSFVALRMNRILVIALDYKKQRLPNQCLFYIHKHLNMKIMNHLL